MQKQFDDPFGEETLDVQKIIKKYLYLWPWFIISLLVALGITRLNNAYKHNVYENNMILLIHDDDALLTMDEKISSSFSSSSGRQMQNQIGIITSRSLVAATVQALDFSVEYFLQNSFVDTELYPNNYFTVEPDSIWPQPVNVPLLLSRNDNGTWNVKAKWERASLYSFSNHSFVGHTKETDITTEAEPGQWLELPNLRFRIHENPANLPDASQQFRVVFRDHQTLTRRYRGVNVSEVNNSTMLRLSIQGGNRNKNAAFLNMHAQKFLMRDLNKKNYRAQKTINFIEEQLGLVAQWLNHSETDLEHFRSSTQTLNLDYQAQRSYARLDQLQQEKTMLMVKEKYYQYLENYLTQVGENGSDLIAPSSLGVDDPLLSGLIVELMKLYTERSEVMINSRRDNPFLSNLESRIEITKKTVRESLKNIMLSNRMAMDNIDERVKELTEKISTIPESQRHLFNIERQFNLHDNLYTFLQSRKSEIEITKAGFTPVHEVLDSAISGEGRLVSPKTRMSYYIATLAGIMLPILLVFLYEFFNDKVRAPEDIEKITHYPILGYISRNTEQENQLISFRNQSILAECFRSIRTNAQFVIPTRQVPVILFTSTLLEEGKTFASLNMAAGYASMGKKTILLSFDLRKPRLQKYMEEETHEGISNLLSSELTPAEVIRKSPLDNLDIIYSGQIPPNPAELLNSPKMDQLFDFLREKYEMIIIDTPPVGMVADALLLTRFANVIFYLVRHNSTPAKYLQQTLHNLKDKDIPNVNIIFNDIPPPGRFNYYNAYGYQYGYFDESTAKTKKLSYRSLFS